MLTDVNIILFSRHLHQEQLFPSVYTFFQALFILKSKVKFKKLSFKILNSLLQVGPINYNSLICQVNSLPYLLIQIKLSLTYCTECLCWTWRLLFEPIKNELVYNNYNFVVLKGLFFVFIAWFLLFLYKFTVSLIGFSFAILQNTKLALFFFEYWLNDIDVVGIDL